jgi:hypothetical protein
MGRNFLVLALAMAISHFACGADNNATGGTSLEPLAERATKQADNMKIRIRIKDRVLTATLIDLKTYRIWLSLFELYRYYSWIIDRFHISTQMWQAAYRGRKYRFRWLEPCLSALGFRLIFCWRTQTLLLKRAPGACGFRVIPLSMTI